MRKLMESASRMVRRAWQFVVLFAIVRLAAGIALVALGGGFAWSVEVTAICAGAVIVYLLVALAVRRWAPPRGAS